MSLGSHPSLPFARLHAGDLFGRSRDPAEGVAEIGHVDHRKQQTRDPEDVHVREERNEAEHGNDFELHLVGLVRDVFGQGVQAEEQNAEARTRRAAE